MVFRDAMRMGAFAATAMLAVSGVAVRAQQDEPEAAALAGPDFSAILTAEDIEPLVADGTLVPILVVPPFFGGSDDAINTAYVPPEAAAQKKLIDATLVDLAEQGLLNSFELEPEYRGQSLVPARLTFRANHAGEGDRFDLTVEVW